MLFDNFLRQLTCKRVWCFTRMIKHVVVIVLCLLLIFVPPQAKSRHIVGAYGCNTAIRVAVEVPKSHVEVFRHRLNFKTKDAQLVHNPLHTGGNHAQIFSTNQHLCSLNQCWKLLHCFAIPILIVSFIIIIFIQSIERIFVVLPQSLIHMVLLSRYSGMEKMGIVVVSNKEYIANQCK